MPPFCDALTVLTSCDAVLRMIRSALTCFFKQQPLNSIKGLGLQGIANESGNGNMISSTNFVMKKSCGWLSVPLIVLQRNLPNFFRYNMFACQQ